MQKDKQVEISKEQNSYFDLEKLDVVHSEAPSITYGLFQQDSVGKRKNKPQYHEMLTQFNDKYGCPVDPKLKY